MTDSAIGKADGIDSVLTRLGVPKVGASGNRACRRIVTSSTFTAPALTQIKFHANTNVRGLVLNKVSVRDSLASSATIH